MTNFAVAMKDEHEAHAERDDAITYRKRPVSIKAVQFEGGMPSIVKITERLEMPRESYNFENGSKGKFYIHTLEGTMTANVGDWIIKGVVGEFYSCKPDVFEMTYEKVK